MLSLRRTLAASRERVFHAWTDPEEIKRWFGPDTCQVVKTEVDLRFGGAFRFRLVDSQQGEYFLRGEFREVVPPAKLVYTWQWEDDPDYADRETVVTVEFIDFRRFDGSASYPRKSSERPECQESRAWLEGHPG